MLPVKVVGEEKQRQPERNRMSVSREGRVVIFVKSKNAHFVSQTAKRCIKASVPLVLHTEDINQIEPPLAALLCGIVSSKTIFSHGQLEVTDVTVLKSY